MVIVTRSQSNLAAASHVDLGSSLLNRTLGSRKKKKPAIKSSTSAKDKLEDEPIEKLLEGFAKDSLVLLAKEAVCRYPELIQNVRKLALSNPALRKIVVMSLSPKTTVQTLTSVFSVYGEIEDYQVGIRYAHILFKHRCGALNALKKSSKVIDHKIIWCELESHLDRPTSYFLNFRPGYGTESSLQNQPPLLQEEEPIENVLEGFGREYLLFFVKEALHKYDDLIETGYRLADTDPTLRQIFVTGLHKRTPVRTLKTFFGQYGEVEEIYGCNECISDSGNCFIFFKHRNGARKALKQRHQNADIGSRGSISIWPIHPYSTPQFTSFTRDRSTRPFFES